MDHVHVIRHKVLVEALSARRVAREMAVSRNTVRRYLELAAPTRVESQPRPRPVWETVRGRLQELLTESPQWTAGKQRLTATRLHQLLRGEGFDIGVTMVKQAVAEWKRQRSEVFVPLVYRPGELGIRCTNPVLVSGRPVPERASAATRAARWGVALGVARARAA